VEGSSQEGLSSMSERVLLAATVQNSFPANLSVAM
jgi:hypothetical protein